MGPISQHSILFVPYEWELWARVLHYTNLERSAKNKHSSLLGQLVSHEENKLCPKNYFKFD